MNKFCTNCGKELGGAKFCPNCGAPADNNQRSTVTEKVKTDNSRLIILGFLGAYLVLMFFKCMEFSAPILGNLYSLKFFDIFTAIFKLGKYASSDIKTIFLLCFGIAAIAELVLMIASIRGLIKIFTTEDSALPQMSLASSSAITLSAVVMLSTFIIKAMLNSAPGGNYLNYGNVVSLSGATVFLLMLGIIGAVVESKLDYQDNSAQIVEQNPANKLGKCELCDKENVTVSEIIINDRDYGELHRNACEECIVKLNSENTEQKIEGEINE